MPFEGATAAVIYEAILNGQPPPPSALSTLVSAELDRVILKALEKHRDLRYQTARDIGADLRRLRRDSTSGRQASALRVTSRAKGVFGPARGWLRRHRLAALASLVGVGAFGAFLADVPALPRVTGYRQITADRAYKYWPVTDGSRVYFTEARGAFVNALVQVSAGGSDVAPIQTGLPSSRPIILDVSADGSELLVAAEREPIGGGNVAMDAARMALRSGAQSVSIVYRRSEREMPARREEVVHAREEGVVFEMLQAPTRILGDEAGWVRGVEVRRMALGEPDTSGRRRPEPIPGSEHVLEADAVIVAIGNEPNPLVPRATPYLLTTRSGNIVVDAAAQRTSLEGVFAGGDIVLGAATVILAMGEGRRAAKAIAKYLDDGDWTGAPRFAEDVASPDGQHPAAAGIQDSVMEV
jgi:Pyridine nucleotide-disulphide oxidoreductase